MKNVKLIKCMAAAIFVLCFLFCFASLKAVQADTYYVEDDASDTGNGTSWENAFKYLQDALAKASAGDEIWVAQGTYKPDQGDSVIIGDRSATFQLIDGVKVKGGFKGRDNSTGDENNIAAYQTILSGDLNGDDGPNFNYYSDNSFTVVKGPVGGSLETIFEGFTVKGGNNWEDSYNQGGGMVNMESFITIRNCVFKDNRGCRWGGGMSNRDCSADMKILNCFFVNNSAGASGGGIFNFNSPIEIINCVFSGNSARIGGGIKNNGSWSKTSPKIINCTFHGNSASGYGEGIYTERSHPIITNCIFWNSGKYGDEIYNYKYNSVVSYCNIEGGYTGAGNIDDEPLFVNAGSPAGEDGVFFTLDDGLRVRIDSPCIDSANGDVAQLNDIIGLGRIDINDVPNTGTGTPLYTDIGACETGHDSDSDGMPDEWESFYGLNPENPDDANGDADNDSLTNLQEYSNRTDPTSKDTDHDGMPDAWELDNNLNPLIDDADGDMDSDGWTNLEEYQLGYDPNNSSPDKPIGLSRADDGRSLTPTLRGSGYFDTEADSHLFTEWQVAYDIAFSKIVFTDTTAINKQNIKLGLGILKPETTYYFRVRYSDLGGWSQFSDPVKFTTESLDDFLADNEGISLISNVIWSDTGTVVCAYRLDPAGLPNSPPGYYFYNDVFSFRIEDIIPGSIVHVTFQLDERFLLSHKWWKYYPSLGVWDNTYTAHIITGIGTDRVTLEFKDGGFGDIDGVVNGVIVDPSGSVVKNNKSVDNNETAKNCFIATAAYGTPMAGELRILREFRNKYLLTNPVGEIFVSTYYRISPPFADFISEHPVLKSMVKSILRPLVWVGKNT